MKEKTKTKEQEQEIVSLEYKLGANAFLDLIAPPVKELLLASFKRESKTSMLVRFTNGQTFRISVEEVV
ncbi:MAG: hypothetical protein IJW64_04090 [Clostridia bacterium]|nr:hypothetical protein [Clostridia bacterium]